jgi:hypothetical protein
MNDEENKDSAHLTQPSGARADGNLLGFVRSLRRELVANPLVAVVIILPVAAVLFGAVLAAVPRGSTDYIVTTRTYRDIPALRIQEKKVVRDAYYRSYAVEYSVGGGNTRSSYSTSSRCYDAARVGQPLPEVCR